MKKIAIGQAGGPTTVINATLAGFVKNTMKDHALFFVRNGYEGLVKGNFLKGTDELLEWVLQNERVPGACLGSGRYPFSPAQMELAVRHLKNEGIDSLVFIGGNGTMEALSLIGAEAKRQQYDLQLIGLPKTVDNDLGCTDHAPGFGSSARYVAQTTNDISRDLHSMQNFEQVRILETMGRNAGWLAASSGLLRRFEEEGPHYIALPEKKLNVEELVSSVDEAVSRYGYATIVVSEGVKWAGGEQVELETVTGRTILGGISKQIESFLKDELHVTARAEILGMNQRSFSYAVSSVDRYEAFLCGEAGGHWVRHGHSGVMVSLQRSKDRGYNVETIPVALEDVVRAGERMLPSHFIQHPGEYYKWLRPLIGEGLSSYPPPIQRRDLYVN
ncbi:diphosphate--fructose-6-phosphate 1-phosphotransferase [Rossellomorea sp. GCM10028870]|uniref:diphosphate--fructose-6-phosphate 1-phosphotransferase n=1 Tax=Rossellomorea sp. GCM10028870 TaxID=3273426 RepID=UPI00361CBECF